MSGFGFRSGRSMEVGAVGGEGVGCEGGGGRKVLR